MIPPFVASILFNKYTAALVVVLSVLGYIYFLRSSVDTLEKEKAALVLVVEQQKQALEQFKKDIKAVVAAKDEYIKATEDLANKKKELEETLYRENKKKKSLEELAVKKSSLIQKKVNNATDEVFKCFEALSAGGDC